MLRPKALTKKYRMGRKYAIRDQGGLYFVTFTVVNWIDLFIRDEYKEMNTKRSL